MRELPNTGVKLWSNDDEQIIPEGVFWAEDLSEDSIITAYIDVMELVKAKRIVGKAKKALAEFNAQMKETE